MRNSTWGRRRTTITFAVRRLRPALAVLTAVLLTIGVLGAPAAQAATCPCSIWSSTATPVSASDPDGAAVELGVKFRSDVDGYLKGVRFYKGSGNSGTHVGHLWDRTGALLATATFSGETATGWQEVSFSAPVPITANTTYIASYYAPNGHYAGDNGGFAASGVDNAPLHALRDGTDGGNGVYAYGTGGGFPVNTWQSTNYWVDVVFDTSATDTTPPTVTSTSPASNATGVPITTAVSATFSEPVQPATIVFSLKDSSNATVPASQSYDPATRTATLTPSSALAASTQYTATISGVQDSAGNTIAQPYTWSFTTSGPVACPCTVWPSSATPAVATVADGSAVELGVKFRSSTAGVIKGVRFYKGSQNTGTHTGTLWSQTGSQLATATFSGETPSGWQQVLFASPVSIAANTTYVASYHTNTGFYSADNNGLASAVSNGPLTALANGTDGGNGVYLYGASGFPSNTYQGTNYWVDVVFDLSGQDTTPPTVVTQTPAPGAVGVAISTTPSATFSEDVQPSSVAFTLSGPGGANVPGTVSYASGSRTATFTPTSALSNSTPYTATVSGAKDLAGNTMAGSVSWSFTTAAPPPPPPTQGPGGPVLVIGNTASTTSQFSLYTAEILRAEGLNEFATTDLANVTASTLSSYDVVILGATPLSTAQVTMFTTWVTDGGRLIAFRPDKQLAALLGLTTTTSALANGYLKVNTTTAPGAGITDQTIQFHGTADQYTMSGATSVATLYSNATSATTAPAVTLRSVGTSGGSAAAFTYDLPQSIVYTRQGNSAWAGQERDGQAPIRSDDLYFGGRSATDWVNLNKVAIPQADEQQRLLANLIGTMELDKKPLPRFWYFPRGAKAVVVPTGDDHGNGGTAGRFDQYQANSPTGCSVDNWSCLRFSSYMYPGTPLSDGAASGYRANGFEMGLHPQNNCSNYTPTSLESSYATQLSQFAQSWPSLPGPQTSRYHCIVYSDWASQPKTELNHGIRLDANYYYWPPTWINDRPGFMTGSGLPMRFADTNGTMIDVYQAATQMTDESGQSYPATPNTLLDNALGPLGYYGAFTANMHTDSATTFEDDQLLASATARGVPMITARQLLNWVDGRNGSAFSNLAWNGNTLTFGITVGAGANGLNAMVPAISASGGTLSTLTKDGSPVSFSTQTIKGVSYAFFTAAPGSYTATYSSAAAAAPAIGTVTAQATGGTATVTWTTSKATTSQISYGTAPSSLDRQVIDGSQTTRHQVTLTGLAPNTTYYYRVTSTSPRAKASTARSTTTAVAPSATTAVASVQTSSVDATPPAVSGVGVFPLPDGTASVTWQTDEPADSTVEYGLSPDSLGSMRTDPAMRSSHALVLTRLAAGMTYYYRVVSNDAAGNAATTPDPASAPASFVSSANGVADRSTAQLRMAKSRSGVYLQQDSFGEVSLAPQDGQEFSTPDLPSTWTANLEDTSGRYVVTGGNLNLDGERAGGALVGPGRSLQFSATFAGLAAQYAGWLGSVTDGPFALIGAKNGGIYAVTSPAGPNAASWTRLPGTLLGQQHKYRIDWTSTGVAYYVDGKVVSTVRLSASQMRPVARDTTADGIPLVIDWFRMSGYSAKGSFASRVLDARQMVNWDRAYWRADVPNGTTLTVSVRTGSTPSPDATWTAWTALSGPGARVAASSRYIQYRVDMATSVATTNTPVLRGIGFTNNAAQPPATPGEGEG